MAYDFELEVEQTISQFFVNPNSTAPYATARCVINEKPVPQGLYDRIIKNNQPWDVTFYFNCSGDTANNIGPFDWNCSIYLLRLDGPGGVTFSKSQTQPYATGTPGVDDYKIKVDIPATTNNGVPVGVYELHTSVDVINSPAILPISMMGEGPTMKFYKP